jgi:hypothetical protein
MAEYSFTISQETIQSLATKSAAGTSEFTRGSKTSRVLEFWVNVTAITGGLTLTPYIETSLDGTNWVTQKTMTGITAAGIYTTVVNRADYALGKSIRVSWTLGGASATFEILMGRME